MKQLRLFRTDWHEKTQLLLLAIFFYQYVVWFTFYWLEQTAPIVSATLAAAVLCGWLIPKGRTFLRAGVAVIACLWITAHFADPSPAGGDLPNNIWAPLFAAWHYFSQLTPFLWFSLGAWFSFFAMFSYLQTKWRLFSVMIFSIVLFCIVDSFSLFQLWDQVAIMVGCGLLMLVIFHLKQLKTSDPDGYKRLMNYPLPITVMIVTIISASLVLGILAPNIRPLVVDPYTAWKTYQGEVVAKYSTGQGIASYGVSGTMSGYSRDDSNLGGGFTFDYTAVFTVESSHESYWRGETRTLYNGSGWESGGNLNDLDEFAPIAKQFEFPLPQREGRLETIEVTHTFFFEEGQTFPALFSAPYPVKVSAGEGNEAERRFARGFWDLDDQAMLWAENSVIPYPTMYTVTSRMPVIDEDKLRTAPPTGNARAFRNYLQLPANLPERVERLALEVTADAESPYEKAKALERFLSTAFTYTNVPDLTKRSSPDFVDSFLFEVQEGYCDYYSTAMVVMARTIGLPARWVKGYTPGQSGSDFLGEFLPVDPKEAPAYDTYTVRNSDAHSWAELYFEGYGWIPFEPTPGFALPVVVQTEYEAEAAVAADVPVAEEIATDTEEAAGGKVRGAALTVLISAMAGGFIVFLAVRFQWLTLLRTRSFRKSPNYSIKFLAEMERLMIRLRRKGLPWKEHETLREMMMQWMQLHGNLQQDMEALLLTFEKAKYSGAGLTEQEYRMAEQHMRKLRESI